MSESKQAPIGKPPTEAIKEALKQILSSGPGGSSAAVEVHGPPSNWTELQYSKCPSSSANAMFALWSSEAQGTPVCSLDVAYIGWKLAGKLWVAGSQLVPFGSNRT